MFEQMVFAHLQFTRTAVSSDQRGCTSAVGKGFGVYHEKNHGTNETAAGWTSGVIVLKAGTPD